MIEGMDKLNRRLDAITDTRQLMGQLGLATVAYAKTVVPRRTGNLGRTIRLGTVTDDSVTVLAGGRSGVGYARAVEFGTQPHVIVPRRRKALAWGGRRRLSGALASGSAPTFFAKRVNHPGTRAQPYLRPAAEFVTRETGARWVIQAWNEAA